MIFRTFFSKFLNFRQFSLKISHFQLCDGYDMTWMILEMLVLILVCIERGDPPAV